MKSRQRGYRPNIATIRDQMFQSKLSAVELATETEFLEEGDYALKSATVYRALRGV
ncbi:MAG: hypothetical protein AAGA30_05000 [Planctomycetota bacterium]